MGIRWLSFAVLLALAACKKSEDSQVADSTTFKLAKRNCYTYLTIARVLKADSGKSDALRRLVIQYSNGDCHSNGKATLRTLDRYTQTDSVLLSDNFDGKSFPSEGAVRYQFCLKGKSVVIRKNCATGDDEKMIGNLPRVAVGALVDDKANVAKWDISYQNSPVTADVIKKVGSDKINLWVNIK